ncbi:CRISPR-associated endonuclease Cas3'' [Dokdonella sp.]|uniref:type I-G CRISPR-associated helicase/endonuclease Cas3g n=1 Tax=Dokdonella sp. TaxID=2291710 RepID=UPI0031C50FE3|nr:CRISPR-associated endonuclease Cas3'' [Dokdonella sp.]
MAFDRFFADALGRGDPSGLVPYAYQQRLAQATWPDLLDVPTGLGKTAAVTLAWLWKRGWRRGGRSEAIDPTTPRRLVWCLPMRVLVEQAESNIRSWLDALGIAAAPGGGKVSVHVLIGGAEDLGSWAEHPEEDMILIGTQDMLLSRALMRGYGMSRYQWPIHFALLHNDCLWVFDEVQLMGAGLPTSTQLEAFRRDAALAPARASRSLWVSATLHKDWLGTVDFAPHLDTLQAARLQPDDLAQQSVQQRLSARKALHRANTCLAGGSKGDLQAYIDSLADEVAAQHQTGSQTLVILNNVERAQRLHEALGARRADATLLLLHARFRAEERREIEQALRREPSAQGRIIIATQAIEAGVDITSRTLFSELAPWASMVQRFGRCNRDGVHAHADVFWIDIAADADKLARPYDDQSLSASRELLIGLDDVGSSHLPQVDAARPLTQVLRRRDLLELFNTEADLSGFDVDVSPYIRDSGIPPVQVFWRKLGKDGTEAQGRPERRELCPASIGQLRGHLGSALKGAARQAWRWDVLERGWVKVAADQIRPGMTLLLDAADGGYDARLGFVPGGKRPVEPLMATVGGTEADSNEADFLTQIGRWVSLPQHLADVAEDAVRLCQSLHTDSALADAIVEAGRWHDLGKAHAAFQNALEASGHEPDAAPPWAKSNGRGRLRYFVEAAEGRQLRRHFRHELASMLAWLEHGPRSEHHDLIAYLIAAHHGKVRMGLRALPDEHGAKESPDTLFARGVWDGDQLPALAFDGRQIPQTTLRLDLMQLGRSERQGASWSARTQALLRQHGPFRLAWFEALVRIADWRASAREAKP